MEQINLVSTSGGKDSQAALQLALESGADNVRAIFADTGNENPITYEHVNEYIPKVYGVTPVVVRADFSGMLAAKRRKLLDIASGNIPKRESGYKYPWTPEAAEQAAKHLEPTGNQHP